MLALFPGGFEELEFDGGVELAAYTDAHGEAALVEAFGSATGSDVDAGWEERWRDFHRPILLGSLWVGPPWLSPPSAAVAVVVDPGRAFGTGAHPTTRLCLELLLELDRSSVLDIGCGSGVLAVAAAKLGFAPVVALDIDPAAVEATRRNAEANGVSVAVRRADARTDRLPSAAIALANIDRGAVEQVAPRLNAKTLIASGYLESEQLRLTSWRHLKRCLREGWAADLYARE